jgi:predicted lipoprotein
LGSILVLSGCDLATVRPLDPETGKAIIGDEDEEFDAERFVDSIWQDPLLTTVRSDAVELQELLPALDDDREGASERFGNLQGSNYSFLVKGRGQVLEVDTSSRAGLMHVDLEPTDGAREVTLAIGPVIRGTALRSALPFISFNDFVNQIEYAQVSNQLNARVVDDILDAIEPAELVGETIEFYGAFTLVDLDEVVITPVEIEVE